MKKVLALVLCLAMTLSVCAIYVSAETAPTWKDGQINDPADTNPDDGQNLKFDNAYGYTFVIEDDKKIGGEDNALVETVDEYKACNPNWAISVLLAPEGDLYKVVTVVATPGSADAGLAAGINFDNGNIVIVAHSAYSHAAGANFESKLCALALKEGDMVKVADDKSSAYVLIPGVDDKEEDNGPAITETAILSTGKSYTATAPNRGDSFDDNGVKLTNGVKGLEDAGTAESAGWNNTDKTTANVVEVVVNLGESVLSNSYTVYLAGGNWGIGVPSYNAEKDEHGTSIEIFASDSADGEFAPVASAADTEMVLKTGTGLVDSSWSTFTLTATAATPVQAQYIKFVITAAPVGNAFIWMDEVEVAAVKTTSAPSVEKETITVDGDLADNGWASDKWVDVSGENGFWQQQWEFQTGAKVCPDFGYKYQLRADDTKLYAAVVIDGDIVNGGNGAGTFVRFWVRDNDEATVYTSFYDFGFADGELTTAAKYNTSTTTNAGAAIEGTTVEAKASVVDGNTVIEFSVDVAEFSADGNFDYYICASQKVGEDFGTLYYPAAPIGPTSEEGGDAHQPHANLPWLSWHAETDATVNVADIALGEIVTTPGTPETGDAGIYAIAGLALVAMLGTAIVIKKRA